jgi:hypothetical protein
LFMLNVSTTLRIMKQTEDCDFLIWHAVSKYTEVINSICTYRYIVKDLKTEEDFIKHEVLKVLIEDWNIDCRSIDKKLKEWWF